jgi:hypothetical protein
MVRLLALASLAALLRAAPALSGSPPPAWHAPSWWLAGALCIHAHEGAWNDATGNGYYGGMQFLPSTWASVGGRTRPDLASPREQLYRAYLVWRRDGGSWREWGTAGSCGLR